MPNVPRRQVLAGLGAFVGLGWITPGQLGSQVFSRAKLPFKISLAEWSLHRALQSGTLHHLEFPTTARRLDFEGVEYVNQFFMQQAKDFGFLSELRRRCNHCGVKSLLIMCDGEGHLGAADAAARTRAIENHRKWIGAAAFLGCHSIRVNAHSEGSPEEQKKLVADGLAHLTEFAMAEGLDVLVENHGGLSSNGAWVASLMRTLNNPSCGTLPDFGNFQLGGGRCYDRYQGVKEMMPFAKAVSAKTHDFDAQGRESHTDFQRMLAIVLDSGYRAWIGVEYEGTALTEEQGILATRKLLLSTGTTWLQTHPQSLSQEPR